MTDLAEATKSIWLSVEYRLAPENKYPIPMNDALSAAEWIVENKSRFGNENTKVGVAGDSAGGNLAAYLANELNQKLDYFILIYSCLYF